MTTPTYDELMGGVGRSVHFRSERYLVRVIFRQIQPELTVAEQRAKLHDMSMNGLSYDVPVGVAIPKKHTELPLQLSLAGEEAFSGTGRVVRIEMKPDGRGKVAVNIVDSFLDVPRLIKMHDDYVFGQKFSLGMSVYDLIPEAYRRACSEVAVFLRHWKTLLDSREEQLGDDVEEHQKLEMQAEESMRKGWETLRMAANDASRPFMKDKKVRQAAKMYTELMVTPLVEPAPLLGMA